MDLEPIDPVEEPQFGSFTVHLSNFGGSLPSALVVFDPCARENDACPIILADLGDGRRIAFRDRHGLFRLLSEEASRRVPESDFGVEN